MKIRVSIADQAAISSYLSRYTTNRTRIAVKEDYSQAVEAADDDTLAITDTLLRQISSTVYAEALSDPDLWALSERLSGYLQEG